MTDKYCLDTSVLINSWNEHYRIDVFPGVWDALDGLIAEGRLLSCEEVYHELERQRDDLLTWAKARKQIFESPTGAVTAELATIMSDYPNFAAAGGTRNAADPWLIAHARIADSKVVTFERMEATRPTKPPKIPNVCQEMGVPCLTPINFLKEVGFSF